MSSHHRPENQLTITKVLIMPETKPDIERILRVTSTSEINKPSTIPRKVALTGKVTILVEYVACSPSNNQPMHFAEFEIPFAHFIDHRGIKPCQNANVCVCVEFQEVQVIDRRSINIFLIIKAILLRPNAPNRVIGPHACLTQNIPNATLCRNSVGIESCCVEYPSASKPCSFGTCIIECE